ncbi:MAG: hypothetical protein AAGN64_12345, partial [Bacteroidota bacterium]
MPLAFASSESRPPASPRDPDGALVVAPPEPHVTASGMRVLNGLAVAPGIAMGQAYVYEAGA